MLAISRLNKKKGNLPLRSLMKIVSQPFHNPDLFFHKGSSDCPNWEKNSNDKSR